MTRFAIDAPTALLIVRERIPVAAGDQLVAPSVLRSHALSLLYREVRDGDLDERTAQAQLRDLAGLTVRLLGDRVSRATAWKLAAELQWDDTPLAEYLAVAVLQADVLVTDDAELSSGASGRIPVSPSASLDERP
ncbi:hypothetical protein [Microbacterium sp. P05]|uniref:hypothetical protein n=1 Tax=Microbacterium sp. P05 TaxID=3366948 RepID=UPI003745ABBB